MTNAKKSLQFFGVLLWLSGLSQTHLAQGSKRNNKPPIQTAIDCRRELRGRLGSVTEGELIDVALDPLATLLLTHSGDEKAEVRRLSGERPRSKGIYRLLKSDGSEEVFKFYPNWESDLRTARSEKKKMEDLNEWLQTGVPAEGAFRVAHVSEVVKFAGGQMALRLQSVKGRSLQDILNDETVSKSDRVKLAALYEKRAKHYDQVMLQHGYRLRVRLESESKDSFYLGDLYYLEFRLNPSQVIVDIENLDMWIIDPL